MSYVKIITSAAIVGLMSSAANAQVKTVNELPITYGDNGVIQAQYIKPGDVSPEEYQRLLDEADKIRAFRSNSDSYSNAIVNSEASVDSFAGSYSTVTDANGYEIQLFDGPVSQPASVTHASTITYQPTFVSVPVTQSHTVAKGDTLYSLSKRFGVSVDGIRNANGLAGNALKIDQLLTIPQSTATMSAQSFQSVPTTTYASTYQPQTITESAAPFTASNRIIRTVQPIPTLTEYGVLPGDNLYRIAKAACTSGDILAALNGISDVTSLQPGQMLKMPEGHCLQK